MEIYPVLVPLLNVNDDSVVLVEWIVDHGEQVRLNDPICVVETSKAATDLEAEDTGVLFHLVDPNTTVQVGEPLGLIGPNLGVIEAYLDERRRTAIDPAEAVTAPPIATPRARSLAEEYGVDLDLVAADGIAGTVKEEDVRRYVAKHEAGKDRVNRGPHRDIGLPHPILERVVADGELSKHENFVASSLQQTLESVILATAEAEILLTAANDVVREFQRRGSVVTPQHVILWVLGRTLIDFPRLISFRHAGQIFRYRDLDVAFVVKNLDGLLFTPVVRGIDRLSLIQISNACHSAALKVIEGTIKPGKLEGACFTVSLVATPGLSRFTALPNRFQSAILAVGAEYSRLSLGQDGVVQENPVANLTLSYDHALCDAAYVAAFFNRLRQEITKVT